MNRTYLVVLFAAITTSISNAAAAVQENHSPFTKASYQLLPGQGIGPLLIGDSRKKALEMLGSATRSMGRSPGITEDYWYLPNDFDARASEAISIIYAVDKIIQVSVNSGRFVAPGGVTTQGVRPRDSLANALSHSGPTVLKVYEYPDADGQSYLYDDVAGGIAFEIGTDDYFSHDATITSFVIHRKGKPALPSQGASIGTPIFNVPPKPLPPPPVPDTRPVGSGLPIRELFASEYLNKFLYSQDVLFREGQFVTMSSSLLVERAGKPIHPPIAMLRFETESQEGIWQGVQNAFIHYGDKTLNLAGFKGTDRSKGNFREYLAVQIPLTYFAEISKQARLTVSIGDLAFGVKSPQLAGLRALAARLQK